MCGIAGIVGPLGSDAIGSMTRSLGHRGPDGCGWAGDGRAWVGVTRLAVVGLSADSRPIHDESGTICLVFNGEIYNHRELRHELQRRGHRFTTSTDSEVVVHLYEELGPSCVHRLRGMFAFGLLHGSELFLARDRLGIKPLHFAAQPGTSTFLFASEAKAILGQLDQTPQLDMQAFADWVALGHLVGGQTAFEGIHTLPPGHTMRISFADGLSVGEPVRYHHPAPARDDAMSYEDAEDLLVATFEDAVRRHLDADVEVGFTLSGGIDSTLLALFAAEQSDRPLRTFTVADHADHPDVVQAEAVARAIGSKHRTFVLKWDGYLAAIPRLAQSEEFPASLFATPFQYLCEQVAKDVKACIHGEGADELFGGYVEYLARNHRSEAFQRRLPLLARLGVAPSAAATETILRLSTATTWPEYLDAVFAVNMGDPLQRLHLDGVDRSAMSAGLEMRVPYLDDEMVAAASRVPHRHLVRVDIGVRKYVLRRLALRRFSRSLGTTLVDVVLREKLGAPASGVRLLQRFAQLCERRLPTDYLDRHELGFCFTSARQLVMFEYFREVFLRRGGDASAADLMDFIDAGGRSA